jgi:hypothetical protein
MAKKTVFCTDSHPSRACLQTETSLPQLFLCVYPEPGWANIRFDSEKTTITKKVSAVFLRTETVHYIQPRRNRWVVSHSPRVPPGRAEDLRTVQVDPVRHCPADSAEITARKRSPFYECFPWVCPEPVSLMILHMNSGEKDRFLPVVAIAADLDLLLVQQQTLVRIEMD